MRSTGCGMRTARPASSTTSRNCAAAAGACVADCPCSDDAPHSTSAASALSVTATKRVREAELNSLPLTRERSFANKKAPRDAWGFQPRSFSRRTRASAAWEGGLAYGCEADYSGGTAAESHGLPRSSACKLKIECKPQEREVSIAAADRPRNQRFFQFGLRFSKSARRPSWESSSL